mmetsp:Transcript_33908/g.89320  ORF Transcript_33908/g.89320 Transcript_33908/m.89320 type:complete len:109 (-) Transcript_33908:132-458(-)
MALRVGAAVEARHAGGEMWFPGTLAAANDDGTYDVHYDDGDAERGVDAALIMEVVSFSTGAVVEARHGSGSLYYPGRVVRAHGDNTYDVDYDDGDKEQGVRWTLLKRE